MYNSRKKPVVHQLVQRPPHSFRRFKCVVLQRSRRRWCDNNKSNFHTRGRRHHYQQFVVIHPPVLRRKENIKRGTKTRERVDTQCIGDIIWLQYSPEKVHWNRQNGFHLGPHWTLLRAALSLKHTPIKLIEYWLTKIRHDVHPWPNWTLLRVSSLSPTSSSRTLCRRWRQSNQQLQ